MKRCAFLSMDSLEGFHAYDTLLFAPLLAYGWQAEEISWRKQGVDWNQYDVVVIRSTWDYQSDAEAFVRCLEEIDVSSACLQNDLKLVKWNISKDYLRHMQKQGISIVPTLWFAQFDATEIARAYVHFSVNELVIKPLISANADHTYRLKREELLDQSVSLSKVFANRPFMLQPFVPAIVAEGEYSLFYFAGHYSHCILKLPKKDDFRVQEEHGGQLQLVQPSEELLTQARHAMASLPNETLYARVDMVRYDNEYVVMEVELIEPSLYFNMDPASPQRFADAFVECFGLADNTN